MAAIVIAVPPLFGGGKCIRRPHLVARTQPFCIAGALGDELHAQHLGDKPAKETGPIAAEVSSPECAKAANMLQTTSRTLRHSDRIDRVLARPDPAQWSEDELLSLPEAAALFWPSGPLTTASLRTAVRDGKLKICVIASKHFTSRSEIEEMTRNMRTLGVRPPPDDPANQSPSPATTAVGRLANLRRAKGR
jgi:hypothetical protein